jgi:hypothetical protein
VNGDMARHSWRGVPGFRYLGPAWPGGGAATAQAPARASRKAPAPRPAKAGKAPKPRKTPRSQKPGQGPHSLPNLPQSESGVAEQESGGR